MSRGAYDITAIASLLTTPHRCDITRVIGRQVVAQVPATCQKFAMRCPAKPEITEIRKHLVRTAWHRPFRRGAGRATQMSPQDRLAQARPALHLAGGPAPNLLRSPSSTKTATRTAASVTITIRPDDRIDVVETYQSRRSATCALKNLIKRWSISHFDEVLQ